MLSEKEKIGKLERISLSIGHTEQTGPFEFTKTFAQISRDVVPGENPLDGLRGLESLLERFIKERAQKVNQSKQSPPKPPSASPMAPTRQDLQREQALQREVVRETAAPPKTPTETPELYASLLESLEWTPGARVGREWILISRNEEKLRPVLNLMRQIDLNGYHAVGKWKYRIEGDFLARYGSAKPKQTQFPGATQFP